MDVNSIKNYVITDKVKEEGENILIAKLHLSGREATHEGITSVVDRLKRNFYVDPNILKYFGGCTLFYKKIDVAGWGIPSNDDNFSFPEFRSKCTEYDIILALLFLEQASSFPRKMNYRVCVYLSSLYEKKKYHLILNRNIITLVEEIV